jgi:hypothetical protein
MVERICPACQYGNPMENRFCGACGAALEHNALVLRQEDAIVVAGQRIPLAQAKQLGKAVAVGLAAVAAEASIAWIMRRAGQPGASATTALAVRPSAEQPAQAAATAAADVVTIVSQRVVEIWDHGNLTRQIVEKHIWKKEG